MAEESPIPTLLAFLICDTVIQDVATQKRTLVGVFDRIHAQAVPLQLPSLGLYTKMVDGSGLYKVMLRMVNLKDEARVMEINLDVSWTDPDSPMELGMNFGGIPIAEFGTYEFQLWANEAYLGRATMRAVRIDLPPAPPARGN